MSSLIIKNAVICDISGERVGDVEISGGKILQVGENLRGERVFDASGLHLLPALIDLNITPQEYNQHSLEKLQEKALRGGVGSVFLSPSNALSYYEFITLFNQQSKVDFVCGITPIDGSGKIGDIAKLQSVGGESLVFDSCLSNNVLKCVYQYAQMLQSPCMVRAKDEELSNGVSVESELAYKMGLSQIPPYFQGMEFAKIGKLAFYFQVPTLLRLVNEVGVLEDIEANSYLKSEVSIHHLILDEGAVRGYETYAKLYPPLSLPQQKEKMLERLKQIDMLTSSHQEFSKHQKEQTFEDAVCGVKCLELYFSLLYTYFVRSNLLSLSELVEKTSYAQARFLNLQKGEVKEGYDASLILVNLSKTFVPNHPLYSQTLYGEVKAMIGSNGLIEVC